VIVNAREAVHSIPMVTPSIVVFRATSDLLHFRDPSRPP
jgi:hypothetical protein